MDDHVRITIMDDGQGFDTANRAGNDKGLGLVSISERTRSVGGTVSVVSGPQQGTRVQATIPMNARVKVDVGAGRAGHLA
jgi:signal transduction histidine kinase